MCATAESHCKYPAFLNCLLISSDFVRGESRPLVFSPLNATGTEFHPATQSLNPRAFVYEFAQ